MLHANLVIIGVKHKRFLPDLSQNVLVFKKFTALQNMYFARFAMVHFYLHLMVF